MLIFPAFSKGVLSLSFFLNATCTGLRSRVPSSLVDSIGGD